MKGLSGPYKKNYDFLFKHYTREDINERYIFWRNVCEKVIEDMNLTESAVVNYDLLTSMVLNYFADMVRLKDFHEIKGAHRVKIYAYSVFWFLRVSPVQIIKPTICINPYINEKIATWLISSQFIRRNRKNILDRDIISHYEDAILYYFKYRIYTAQSIEMFITSFCVGSGSDPFIERPAAVTLGQ
jgi:hypothetical protein